MSMKSIIETYTEQYKSIKKDSNYAFGLAQSFVAMLLALPPLDKYELLPLFKQIENDAFENGIEIPNLNYENLEKEKKLLWNMPVVATKIKKPKKVDVEENFNQVLFHFFSKYDLALNRVKGYFLFRSENMDDSPTKVRILYDDDFNKHPEINSFDIDEPQYDLKKFKLNEFSELLAKEEDVQNQNYLFVLFITPHLVDNQNLIDEIKKLINSFSSNNFIAIKKKPVESVKDFDYKRIEEGYKAIEYFSGKVFNNRDISFEEESILKTLFPGNEMILDYKILKKGNSGSKVIEIQPLKVDTPKMSRFVAKYSTIDSERKIQDEREKFNQWLRNTGVYGYSADYYKTDTHEAIMYNYASSDSKQDSSPFSKLIDDKLDDKYKYTYTLEQVINELFSCSPYQIWNLNKTEITQPVREIYKEYLKSDEKIIRAISLIKGIDESTVTSTELVKSYSILKDFPLRTYRMIRHGDLHSENFFKDDKGVYLIDFGWTNQHHSLIDHATLECSLKFKHLPFYIPVEELISFETELLSINSFSKSFNLSKTNRQSVLEISRLISQIRESAKGLMLDNNSSLEYLISLFVISFRQIQYTDLNQVYAMHSAEVLSRRIMELIK